jgi:hypothetical protein
MNARHPNRRRLQRWLETGDTRRVTKHIERCSVCQETMEELSALDEKLVADLQAATSPPADLRERTHGGVDMRLRNEAAVGAFLDLFTLGWDFARTVVDPELTHGDGPHDDTDPADHSNGGEA